MILSPAPGLDTTVSESCPLVFLHISCFASPLRIQLVSGNPAMNGDGTCYNPAACY